MRMYMDKVCWIWILLHSPVGATGIPTSGRTDGNISTVSGYVSGSSGALAELSSVMVLDSFERDYYVDMSNVVKTDTRANNFTNTLSMTNNYVGYTNNEQHINWFAYPLMLTGVYNWIPLQKIKVIL